MATFDLEEQEQLSELKTWWKMHGNLVVGLLCAAALAMVAYRGWSWYQRDQALHASAVYANLQQAAAAGDARAARVAAGELIEKYASSAYAGLGALVSARIQYETGDTKTARAQLAWAAEHAADPELRDLARLRLALVASDEGAHDEALKQLAAEPVVALAGRYAEARGDVLVAQQKPAEAIAAYRAALQKIDDAVKTGGGRSGAVARERVRLKLDMLGEGE
jgi:predicted negative regulator of RcsB-dependent stress response